MDIPREILWVKQQFLSQLDNNRHVIIARSPLRISLGGGGTDLPSYFQEHEGFLVAASIDKYVYVSVNRPFQEGITLKYSQVENCKFVSEVSHPIIREALEMMQLKTPQIEITSIADIPSGTGLGSSGSFTTALLKALFSHYRKNIHPQELARVSCHIELERLKEPIGKQDQYIAAFGGITSFTFRKDGTVLSEPLLISTSTLHDLEDNLLLFFTGISRSASLILYDQENKSRLKESSMIDNLHFTKQLGYKSRDALLSADTKLFGELMHEHWEHKRSRSKGISNDFINSTYDLALKNGAVGGKLVGAGGGGFLMFYADDKDQLRASMTTIGLEEVRFKFDFEGTKVILS
jgi:D-glycero-alpha-D-manno-heptose-7-phosphate kinase